MEEKRVKYHGLLDLTVWLQSVNEGDPVVFPERPQSADYTAVGLSWLYDENEEPIEPELVVATSLAELVQGIQDDRLWFCNVPIKELLHNTDAKEEWFNGSAISK